MMDQNSHDVTTFRSASSSGLGSEMRDNPPRDDFPNFDSIEIMRAVDKMPKGWRKLVHEYGVTQVLACREDGLSLADADDALWMGRSARQAQWLATDYRTKRNSWGNHATS